MRTRPVQKRMMSFWCQPPSDPSINIPIPFASIYTAHNKLTSTILLYHKRTIKGVRMTSFNTICGALFDFANLVSYIERMKRMKVGKFLECPPPIAGLIFLTLFLTYGPTTGVIIPQESIESA